MSHLQEGDRSALDSGRLRHFAPQNALQTSLPEHGQARGTEGELRFLPEDEEFKHLCETYSTTLHPLNFTISPTLANCPVRKKRESSKLARSPAHNSRDTK